VAKSLLFYLIRIAEVLFHIFLFLFFCVFFPQMVQHGHEDEKAARLRREKANARERNRMHGQNAVLARLLLYV